jgi:AcrR family transcriptional regulator
MDTSPGPTPRRGRRGPGRALTEDAILDAAIALLDEGGPAAASVRGIATRVGVAPNAVYTYFPDKAAVVRAIVERLLGEVAAAAPFDPAVPWREGVEALALAVRRVLTAHPGAVPLMVGGPMDGPHALLLGERLLELLGRAGLAPEDAAHASYLLIVHAFGSMALEVADLDEVASPLPAEADRVAAREGTFAATPAEHFPLSAAVVPTMAAYVSTDQFVWGLRRILDGIERQATGETG